MRDMMQHSSNLAVPTLETVDTLGAQHALEHVVCIDAPGWANHDMLSYVAALTKNVVAGLGCHIQKRSCARFDLRHP
jgi:hypothetical protein